VERPGGVHVPVTLRAETLQLPLAAGNILPGNVGYLHFTIFSEPAWVTAFESVARLQHQGVRELILDLRFNPGGRLDVAADMARSFLPAAKLIAILKGPGRSQPMTSTADGVFSNMKVVVLLNKHSASASEVLTAALRDHGVAVVVGETSYGKGVGQETHTLLGGRGLKITNFRWLTPKGKNITPGAGLEPAVSVDVPEEAAKKAYEAMMLRLYDSRPPPLDGSDTALMAAYGLLRPAP
jgi:carboxyl-terminal processing protease